MRCNKQQGTSARIAQPALCILGITEQVLHSRESHCGDQSGSPFVFATTRKRIPASAGMTNSCLDQRFLWFHPDSAAAQNRLLLKTASPTNPRLAPVCGRSPCFVVCSTGRRHLLQFDARRLDDAVVPGDFAAHEAREINPVRTTCVALLRATVACPHPQDLRIFPAYCGTTFACFTSGAKRRRSSRSAAASSSGVEVALSSPMAARRSRMFGWRSTRTTS